MPKPPRRMEVKAQNIDETHDSILALTPTSKQDTETQSPQATCTSCGTIEVIQTAGTLPHYAALRCATCFKFIKWLPKPKPEGAA